MSEPNPLRLYLHVPFCDGKCAYCGFYSVADDTNGDLVDRYLDALERERDARVDRGAAAATVYVGGGTPSILSPPRLRRLCALATTCVTPGALQEWTVEANPGTLSPQKVDILRGAGVTRVSLGVQSLNDATLRRIGRRHDARAVGETVAALRDAAFDNVGLDLIANLPGVSPEEWAQTLDGVLALEPAHVSVYALSIEPGSRFAALAQTGELTPPGETDEAAALDTAGEKLAAAGFERYEVSNYARPGKTCLHNLACWRGEDYLGLGPAAASRLGRKRWTNRADVNAYAEAAERGLPAPAHRETLDERTDASERLVFAFRLAEGVDLAAFCGRAGEPAEQARPEWERVLARLGDAGLLFRDGARWRPTQRGMDMADFIAGELWEASSPQRIPSPF